MGYMWTGGKNKDKLFSWRRTMDSCGWGIKEKEESIISVNVQSIKMKYVSNYCVQRCDIYAPIPSICNQSIYLLIVIENWYQSITTQILAINGSSIIHINWLIDIDWYRLSDLSIGYPGIVRHMTSIVQKILVDSNQQEFAMKQTRKKDLVGIVTFWPDWCTSHQSHYFLLYNGIPEFMRKPLMLTVK